MSGKNIVLDDEKIKKSQIDEKRQMKLMLIKYQFQKKNHMPQKNQLNISLDIMMMVSLDHYVKAFSNDSVC